jgi:hypothetical protein
VAVVTQLHHVIFVPFQMVFKPKVLRDAPRDIFALQKLHTVYLLTRSQMLPHFTGHSTSTQLLYPNATVTHGDIKLTCMEHHNSFVFYYMHIGDFIIIIINLLCIVNLELNKEFTITLKFEYVKRKFQLATGSQERNRQSRGHLIVYVHSSSCCSCGVVSIIHIFMLTFNERFL